MSQAPDIIGPVTGYRAWYVEGPIENPQLHSMRGVSRRRRWSKTETARCVTITDAADDVAPHEAPHPHCRCGIYLMDSIHDLLRERSQIQHIMRNAAAGSEPNVAIGRVEAWGRSFHGDMGGRRVQHARVTGIASDLLCGMADMAQLARAYQADIFHSEEVTAARRSIEQHRQQRLCWRDRAADEAANSILIGTALGAGASSPGGVVPQLTTHEERARLTAHEPPNETRARLAHQNHPHLPAHFDYAQGGNQ